MLIVIEPLNDLLILLLNPVSSSGSAVVLISFLDYFQVWLFHDFILILFQVLVLFFILILGLIRFWFCFQILFRVPGAVLMFIMVIVKVLIMILVFVMVRVVYRILGFKFLSQFLFYLMLDKLLET